MKALSLDEERELQLRKNVSMLQKCGLIRLQGEVKAAAAAARAAKSQAAQAPRKPRIVQPAERRRSARERRQVTYNEDDAFRQLLPGAARGPKPPRVDDENDEAGEEGEAANRHRSSDNGVKRGGGRGGARDSGKGRRWQGGKCYDSGTGVTCHWCRQKTISVKVTCTRDNCSGPPNRKGEQRLPKSFCGDCLRNRNGEDLATALASGTWVCPPCRGRCGPGCKNCCNCGPCRKRLNLPVTGQMVHVARSYGYHNVHDYFIGMQTGESQEQITERKRDSQWAAWMVHLAEEAVNEDGDGEKEEGQEQKAVAEGEEVNEVEEGPAAVAEEGGSAADEEAQQSSERAPARPGAGSKRASECQVPEPKLQRRNNARRSSARLLGGSSAVDDANVDPEGDESDRSKGRAKAGAAGLRNVEQGGKRSGRSAKSGLQAVAAAALLLMTKTLKRSGGGAAAAKIAAETGVVEGAGGMGGTGRRGDRAQGRARVQR